MNSLKLPPSQLELSLQLRAMEATAQTRSSFNLLKTYQLGKTMCAAAETAFHCTSRWAHRGCCHAAAKPDRSGRKWCLRIVGRPLAVAGITNAE